MNSQLATVRSLLDLIPSNQKIAIEKYDQLKQQRQYGSLFINKLYNIEKNGELILNCVVKTVCNNLIYKREFK